MTLLPNVPAAISSLFTDKVIKVVKGSRTVANTVYDTFVVNTGGILNQFYVGIYSIDGGVTWQEFGIAPLTFYMGEPEFTPDIYVDGDWRNLAGAGFNMAILNSSGGTLTFDYMIALIDRGDFKSSGGLYDKNDYQFRSGLNYQKVLLNGFTDGGFAQFTVANNSYHVRDITIHHGLGYVPRLMTFVDTDYQDDPGLRSTGWYFPYEGNSHIEITNQDVIWHIGIPANTLGDIWKLYTRVYYDD